MSKKIWVPSRKKQLDEEKSDGEDNE